MYESPIEIIQGQMRMQQENNIGFGMKSQMA